MVHGKHHTSFCVCVYNSIGHTQSPDAISVPFPRAAYDICSLSHSFAGYLFGGGVAIIVAKGWSRSGARTYWGVVLNAFVSTIVLDSGWTKMLIKALEKELMQMMY
mmetsp:Transcript_16166/g.29310  ORF Transcript_16166/g.29310 Transcript_16166/m.29310 type:complete len:106 (-) Transcript_16166:101-418(-)